MEKCSRFGSWKKLTALELLNLRVNVEGRVGTIVNMFLNDPRIHVLFDDDLESIYLMPFDPEKVKILGKK